MDRYLVRSGFPLRQGRIIAGNLALALLIFSLEPGGARGAPWETPLVLTQVPVGAVRSPSTNSQNLIRADLFETSRIVLLAPDGQVRVLSEGFSAACDPDVSFDGQRILFAGKKTGEERWAIWEMGLDGSDTRCVMRSSRDCRQPVYLSSLFTLDSPEPWYTIAYVGQDDTLDESGMGLSTSLYSVKLDGSEPRRISFNPNPELDPFQTRDGRLIFSGGRYPSSWGPPGGQVSLFAMNIDGTELELYGGTQGGRIQQMGCATANGQIVFVESETAAWDGAGQLGGIRAQRPHHSYRPLTTDAKFVYLYPSPGKGPLILVSRRSAHPASHCGIYSYHLETGQTERIFDSPEYHDLQAKIVAARPQPDGRSTVVNPEYDTGLFYALNCYDADPRLQPHLPPGSIQRLRVIEGIPADGAQAGPGQVPRRADSPVVQRRLLGEVPVQEDGSFNIEVPADIPIQLQALDADGMALATCGWIWVKQRENRGCIGCHEDPELIPENSYVAAVRRSSHSLTLPPEKRRSIGFRQHILPILKAKCALSDCHGGDTTSLRLTPPGSTTASDAEYAYAVLLGKPGVRPMDRPASSDRKGYVDPGRARTSLVIWQLLGKDSSRPWDRDRVAGAPPGTKITPMPPAPHADVLSERELRAFVEWIDLGAALDAASQAKNPEEQSRENTP